jgi:hypothetical protein
MLAAIATASILVLGPVANHDGNRLALSDP